MSETKNFVIKYEDWESYNAKTKEEAILAFKKDNHQNSEILSVEG